VDDSSSRPHRVFCPLLFYSAIRNYSVLQASDSVDPDLHRVPALHRADSGRSSRNDQVPGLQRHDLRDEADQVIDAEDKLRCPRRLPPLSVQPGLDLQIVRIKVRFDPGTNGAEGVESLRPRPLPVLLLESRAVTSLAQV